jgi:ribosome-associated toxin RatA of RatAB toxin-antitoxin module
MHTSESVVINAPRERIFEVTSRLENWVPMLPHYRFVRFLDRSEDGLTSTVHMGCWCRRVIPISWRSIHEIKPDAMEVHFTHLRAFTKGMVVVWRYEPTAGGAVNVSITHDLDFRVKWLRWLAEPVISKGFIDPVAGKTLATFKMILEAEAQGHGSLDVSGSEP